MTRRRPTPFTAPDVLAALRRLFDFSTVRPLRIRFVADARPRHLTPAH